MKKIITILILVMIANSTFSQQTDPAPALTKQDYLKKSKNQKTGAWILLGGGTAVAMTGLVIGLGDASESLYGILTLNPEAVNNSDAGGVVALIGLAGMVGSIPLFIASGKNKRKAMSVSFKNETAPQIQKSSFVYRPVPSVSLKINL